MYPTTVKPSTHNNSHSNISHVTSPTTPNADNVSIKDFFINFLQSKTPIRPTTKRRRRVASLGETLTADEAMAKQKKDEEKKKQAEEEKERKRKLRMEKKEMKLKQLNKKQKKKGQKATTTVSMRKSCRKRKRMAETNWEEICGVCMEEWSDETNEEQLWIKCESCNSWFHAACYITHMAKLLNPSTNKSPPQIISVYCTSKLPPRTCTFSSKVSISFAQQRVRF